MSHPRVDLMTLNAVCEAFPPGLLGKGAHGNPPVDLTHAPSEHPREESTGARPVPALESSGWDEGKHSYAAAHTFDELERQRVQGAVNRSPHPVSANDSNRVQSRRQGAPK
jgi:hypothetical protein